MTKIALCALFCALNRKACAFLLLLLMLTMNPILQGRNGRSEEAHPRRLQRTVLGLRR